jgi:two-component system cell cycle response regulator DivK
MALILIVDDNALNRKLAALLLESAGHAVLQAADAERGIDLARRCTPALVLMDVGLPGMSGLEATAVLKRDPATASIPIHALTACAMPGDEQRVRAAGCDGYVPKPIRNDLFLRCIAEALGGRASTGDPTCLR